MTESANAEPSETPDTDMVAIVTIGVPLGFVPDPETNEQRGMLRYAREFITVDADAYEVLFGATIPVRRANLTAYAMSRGLGDPESVVDRCLQEGLLRGIDFDGDTPHDWTDLRLRPVGLAMGPNAKGEWRIHVPGKKDITRVDEVLVDQFGYLLWAASDGRSLEDVLVAVAGDLKVTRQQMAQLVPGIVVALMSEGAAHLDRVP